MFFELNNLKRKSLAQSFVRIERELVLYYMDIIYFPWKFLIWYMV